MYLTDILIENVGPITKLDLKPPFSADGLPKPVILVGANGSGKTVVEATIADALILMATPHFQDIVPQRGPQHAFFKVCGGTNQRVGTPFGLSLVAFTHNNKRATYVDKSGNIPHGQKAAEIGARFPNANWPDGDNHKNFGGFSKDEVQSVCRSSALCFFPSSRRESPHWLNVETTNERRDEEPKLSDSLFIANKLGKPIFIERCREQNKRWILDVLFDSRTEIERDGAGVKTAAYDDINARLTLTIARNNISLLLRAVLADNDVRMHANYRGQGARLAVARNADVIIPSLDHLSLGQSLLFNLFCTIARYADVFDLNKGHNLGQIEGIVIIDEIDAHLHTELQFASLPKLIKLFPRVQFIISTHAPMFMLGMEREFGPDGTAIFELPNGDLISTERFSEFQRSFEYYKQTRAFEQAVRDKILASGKPSVLVEGDTDRDYIIACLEVLKRTDLALALNIDWVGNNVDGMAQGGGSGSLDTVAKAFKTNPALLQRKLLLIYDCDTNKQAETVAEKLYIRKVPHNAANSKFNRGIENLLPEFVAKPEFYDLRTDGKYGGRIEILNKRRLCDWVIAQKDVALFSGFTPLIQFLEELLGIQGQPKA